MAGYVDELGCMYYYLGEYKLAGECFLTSFKMVFKNKLSSMPAIINLTFEEIKSALEDRNEDPLRMANLSYIFQHNICIFQPGAAHSTGQQFTNSVDQVNALLANYT